jgi:hypothetical protein
LASLDTQGLLVLQILEFLDHLDLMDGLEHQDGMDLEDQLDPQDPVDPLDPQDQQVQQVRLVHEDGQGRRDSVVSQAGTGSREREALTARRETAEQTDCPVNQAARAPPDQPVLPVCQEKLGTGVLTEDLDHQALLD